MTSCLRIGIFLFPSFHEVTSLHPPSFQGNYFSTCSVIIEGHFPHELYWEEKTLSWLIFPHGSVSRGKLTTVKPPKLIINVLGQPIFFIIQRFSLLRGICIQWWQNRNEFVKMRGWEFIIRVSNVLW